MRWLTLVAAAVLAFAAVSCGGDAPPRGGDTGAAAPTAPSWAAGDANADGPPPPDGWVRIEGARTEIWLPPEFEGGNLDDDLAFALENLRHLGDEFSPLAAALEANPEAVDLIAFDQDSLAGGVFTNVVVTGERVPSALDAGDYLEILASSLPEAFVVLDQRELDDGSVFADLRLDLSGAVVARQRIYLTKREGVLWSVGFTSSEAEFDERRGAFEVSYSRFRVK